MAHLVKLRTTAARWGVARRAPAWRRLSAPQVFVGSFALLVAIGAVGLRCLPGLYTGQPLGWTDALFTSASAVCVTGLTVADTATYFTFRGQLFVLCLIQVGGLGIVTFTSLIIVALGRRLSLRNQAVSTGSAEVAPHVEPGHLLRDVVLFTFAFEALGAAALYGLWVPRLGWAGAAWPAVFHSVSAFCNAGFSTFSDSLVGSRGETSVLVVIMLLIVVGGIGFLTLEELYLFQKARRRERRFRLSLHSRIVLVTTAALIALPWPLFVVLERGDTLAGLGTVDAWTNALFLSVTARTAGFNTVDYGQASVGANFLTVLLMAIGGSPGSTAGGLKTTTVALIALLAWSRLRGEEVTSAAGRSIPGETIQRAVGLFVVTFAVMAVGTLVLATAETEAGRPRDFLRYLFEAVSAFNTVGLTMGATPQLTLTGKVTAILFMFAGRVGPLVLGAALVLRRHPSGPVRYAYEDVVVG
jgi:trk system potassium uptake protein TrkH